MPLDRKNYSYLERQRDQVAENEKAAADESTNFPGVYTERCDKYYAARQERMDDTARDVLANLWCTQRPVITKPEHVAPANALLRQLASESWQVALALEQTRIGYDDAAFRGKREQEAAAKPETEGAAMGVHNVD